MYKNILVGFDNSEDSKNALKRAEQIYSSTQDCKLTVAHALQEPINNVPFNYYSLNVPVLPVTGGMYPPQASPVKDDDLFHNTQEATDLHSNQVMNYAKSFLKEQGVTAEFELLTGSPTHDLCDFATENHIDLIILGNSGKGPLKKLLVGSVSENIMKKAEMDVLIVK